MPGTKLERLPCLCVQESAVETRWHVLGPELPEQTISFSGRIVRNIGLTADAQLMFACSDMVGTCLAGDSGYEH